MKSMRQSYVPVSRGSIEGGIIALAMLTAMVHLLLAFGNGLPMGKFPILFLLNGIGYLVLLVALYLPSLAKFQPLVRWVLIAYAALTVVVWFLVTQASYDPLDYTVKLAELSLIVLLCVEAFYQRTSQKAQASQRQ